MFKWKNRFWYVDIRGHRLGFEMSRVEHGGVPYLDRFILYVGGPTLRLHKFWRGDDDRAPHDHPWTFWTLPFKDYWEKAYRYDGTWYWNLVKAWRLHRRDATYRHIVVGRSRGHIHLGVSRLPFWTFVVTTSYQRRWGFWPKRGEFVPWRDWPATAEQHDIRKQRSHT